MFEDFTAILLKVLKHNIWPLKLLLGIMEQHLHLLKLYTIK